MRWIVVLIMLAVSSTFACALESFELDDVPLQAAFETWASATDITVIAD